MSAKLFSLFLAATAIAMPLAARAQPANPPANPPSYAQPTPPSNDDVIHGRVVSFDGAYALKVADDRGYIDSVQLRQGTIINPTGLTLAPGMTVTVRGVNQGSALVANQIDTPYDTYAAMPVYPYYPYPVYPYPFGYGPRFSLGIGFGGGYYGHRRFR
jgi:hypothetical protein